MGCRAGERSEVWCPKFSGALFLRTTEVLKSVSWGCYAALFMVVLGKDRGWKSAV